MIIENIIIGQPLVSEERLGVLQEEETVRFSIDDIRNKNGDIFLPTVLKLAGVVASTSQVKQINQQRIKSNKITDPLEKNLWRNIDGPEMTHFKIGKNVFWLIVGE